MKRDWLWDRDVTLGKIKKIFGNPSDPEYVRWAALLLSRKNIPREVFSEYLNKLDFCRHWLQIKRRMRKDFWNNPRIEFWQAVYESLLGRYKGKKIFIRQKRKVHDELCREAGDSVRNLRLERGFTQKVLADRLGVSQQLVSRIENGYENISLVTLGNIFKKFGVKIKLTMER